VYCKRNYHSTNIWF